MRKVKSGWAKKVFKALATIFGAIVFINLLGLAGNSLFFRNELEAISPYGQMVEVNEHKMHVYSMGDGEKTIVLLPGFGVALPSADFGPLMRELSKEYTVVCIDYFGIGFSEQTDTPRTNENYTEETRVALAAAGFTPPYILMPHSASGVYSEYYAAKYPQEVSAIIMLDTTSTAITADATNPPKFIYTIAKWQQSIGLTRLTYKLAPAAQLPANGYTAKEISDYRLFAYHVLNDTIIDQSFRLLDNIKEVNAMAFPKQIPVLKLISSQTVEKAGAECQANHLKRLGAHVESSQINSTHFMYQTNVGDICVAAREFINKYTDVSRVSQQDEPFSVTASDKIPGWKKVQANLALSQLTAYGSQPMDSPTELRFTIHFPGDWTIDSSVFYDGNNKKVAEIPPPILLKPGEQAVFLNYKPEINQSEELICTEAIQIDNYPGSRTITRIATESGLWNPHIYRLTSGNYGFSIVFYSPQVTEQDQELFDKIVNAIRLEN